MNEEGAPPDSGFDDAGPFSVTPEADGVPLDAALREFGPAAFEDLIPRLRTLAADLDAAHTAGFIHGRIHPSKVFVTADATYLIGARVPQSLDPSTPLGAGDHRRWPIQPPYTAPEVIEGAMPAPMADQFSLAAIAYEWMFGRPISGPADRTVDVRTIPTVDRASLSKAFTRALAPEPFRRFASCTDFCDAVAASLTSSLPLAAGGDDEDPVEPFVPEDAAAVVPIAAAGSVTDLEFTAEDSHVTAAEPDLDTMAPVAAIDSPSPVEPRSSSTPRFGGLALLLATFVGAVFGFAAGYMARPRALQSGPPPEIAAAGPDNELTSGSARAESDALRRDRAGAPSGREGGPAVPAPAAPRKSAPTSTPKAPSAPVTPEKIGRLLVRSTPSGASVEVDGVARGVTPLALRDLDLGTREITVSRRGFEAEERRIVLTQTRPSRSVEVRLAASAAEARSSTPRPSTPGSLGKPAVSTGALAIESRPTGAAVSVNGKASGTTPLTINDLPPGEYRVMMTLEGHRPFATTVRVIAGERARAAARLTELEQE